jgi:hypothetical protein
MSARIDITGQRFGRLVALSENGRDKHGQARWLCRCDCGATTTVVGAWLRTGNTKSCGCHQHVNTKDLVGQRFGRLTVIQRNGSLGRSAAWRCQCDCGNTRTASARNLRRGYTKSCGCLQRGLLTNRRIRNLAGQRFGRLVALRRDGSLGEARRGSVSVTAIRRFVLAVDH